MLELNILLAEDMAHERLVIESNLRKQLPNNILPAFSFVDYAEAAINIIKSKKIDLVILDIDFSQSPHSSGMTGLEASTKIKSINPDIYTVVVSSSEEEETMRKAVEQYGVDWYLRRSSMAYEELSWLCKQALLSKMHREGFLVEEKNRFKTISKKAKEVLRKVDAILPHQNILIYGESGTGKELIARRIHANAKVFDQKRPLKILDCSSLSANLFEGEIFGHKKGSFTGAHGDRIGLLKLVDGGDLFLDEIHNIPLNLQQKLLRVLNDGVFSPVGSNEEIKSNFRIIAATNIPIDEAIASGKLLHDFVARISKIRVNLLPLRDRIEDISFLTDSYLSSIGSIDKEFSNEALDYMKTLFWKGNIRELRSLIDTLIANVKIPIIRKSDIINLFPSIKETLATSMPKEIPSKIDSLVSQIIEEPVPLSHLIENIERAYLTKASSENNNLSDLSETTGYSKATLFRRLKSLGLSLK
ncbi:MAG: sigma 54-interacting transcriptional regulator [Oligoflexia bacterium]|nr:sigma 54-interacting transcriptional regulator [Oligoflexia bacterium]